MGGNGMGGEGGKASPYIMAAQVGSEAIGNIVSAIQARKAREITIDMANSAHQREVEDLKKAGLNPILSLGGRGLDTPSIPQIEVKTPNIGAAYQAHIERKRIKADVENMEENIRTQIANQKLATATAAEKLQNAKLSEELQKKAIEDTKVSANQAAISGLQLQKERFVKSLYEPLNMIVSPLLEGAKKGLKFKSPDEIFNWNKDLKLKYPSNYNR